MNSRSIAAVPFLFAACALGSAVAAAPDLEGSRDPEDFERFPGSWIVDYTPSAPLRSYEFITGKVARIRREMRIEHSIRVPADLARVTYRTPDGTRLDDVIAHYEAVVGELGGLVAFTCTGPDCGHSTLWANQVFGVRELAAPDAAQFYVAATIAAGSGAEPARLVSIYVVQRPNRRVYAHVDIAETKAGSAANADGDIAGLLRSRGFAVVTGATPDSSGNLDSGDLEALAAIARELETFAKGTVFVVCHLGGAADPEGALERAEACANAAAASLRAAGVEVSAFGAGAMLPREDVPAERLELVIPGAAKAR